MMHTFLMLNRYPLLLTSRRLIRKLRNADGTLLVVLGCWV